LFIFIFLQPTVLHVLNLYYTVH